MRPRARRDREQAMLNTDLLPRNIPSPAKKKFNDVLTRPYFQYFRANSSSVYNTFEGVAKRYPKYIHVQILRRLYRLATFGTYAVLVL